MARSALRVHLFFPLDIVPIPHIPVGGIKKSTLPFVVMRTRAREDQGVVGKLGHAHASKHREIKIGKIYTNFAKQSSSELTGSSLSSAKRRWMRASWGEYDDAFLFSSYV